MLNNILGSTLVLFIFFLGYLTGRSGKSTQQQQVHHVLMCGTIDTSELKMDTEDQDFPIIDVDCCVNPAVTVLGGRAMCQDCFDEYMDSMITLDVYDNE